SRRARLRCGLAALVLPPVENLVHMPLSGHRIGHLLFLLMYYRFSRLAGSPFCFEFVLTPRPSARRDCERSKLPQAWETDIEILYECIHRAVPGSCGIYLVTHYCRSHAKMVTDQ